VDEIAVLHAAIDGLSVQQRRLREVVTSADFLANLAEDERDELLRMAFADAARQLATTAAFDFLGAAIAMPWGYEFVHQHTPSSG